MQHNSYWEKTIFLTEFDFIIIGSGIVGLSTALYLKNKKPKAKIAIIERGMIPSGASTKNAGFACFGSVSEVMSDLAKSPEEEVFQLVKKRWDGLQLLIKNLGKKNIGYENQGGHDLFLKDHEFVLNECIEKIPYLNKLLKEAIGSTKVYELRNDLITQYGFKNIIGIIRCPKEAQIHTGKMMWELLQKVLKLGVIIFNGTSITHFENKNEKVILYEKEGMEIETKKLLITTNGFAKQLLPELSVLPARAQVLLTKPIKNLLIKGTFHIEEGYYYFRNIDDRILLGGGRNLDFKTEETYEFGLTPLVQDKLEHLLKDIILPNQPVEIEQRWSGIMGMGSEKKYILKSFGSNVFCGVRMSGMGIALGSQVGKELALLALQS